MRYMFEMAETMKKVPMLLTSTVNEISMDRGNRSEILSVTMKFIFELEETIRRSDMVQPSIAI